jgi:hypothetical protein
LADKPIVGSSDSPLRFSQAYAAPESTHERLRSDPLGSPGERFRGDAVARLDGRLTFCVVSAAILYAAPFAWARFGPQLIGGLSHEAAGWGGVVAMAILWPVAMICCVLGLACSALLLRNKAFGLMRLIGTAICIGIPLLMWQVLHH